MRPKFRYWANTQILCMLSGMQKPKRPRDGNQLGKFIVDLATGLQTETLPASDGKDPAAVALGKKGGAARAANLSSKKRSEIAKKAAAKRWSASKK